MKHLKALILKTNLEYDDHDENKNYNRIVVKAFEELNSLKPIEPILKVAANSEDLKIIFDFERDSIGHMIGIENGAKRESKQGNIYIAAKGLMKSEERFSPLSTLAQELCRFAMHLIYDNNGKPYQDHKIKFDNSLAEINKIHSKYPESNEERHKEVEKIKKLYGVSQEFEEILQATKANHTAEANISLKEVFLYPADKQHAELISKVPFLIVAYHRNQEKFKEIRKSFAKLFEFYENRTLLDLQRKFPLMEAGQEVKELNDLVGYSQQLKDTEIIFKPEALNLVFDENRVSVITSNCTLLTTINIYQQLKTQENFDSSFIFLKFESLKSAKIFELAIHVLAVSCAIIDCGNENPDEISKIADHFKHNDLDKRLVFIQRNEQFQRKDAAHFTSLQSWSQLTDETQSKYLDRPISFQGFPVKLQEIVTVASVALKLMPLSDLFEGKLQIGKPLKFDESFHIERKFMPANGFEVNFEEILQSTEDNKVVLLTAEAGMGKTFELNALAVHLKTLFPSFWVVPIDLKELEITFKRERKTSKATKSNDELSRFFNEKVLKIVGFEAKVFSSQFNEDRVILLMDGIDEASPLFKQFSLNLIKQIEEQTSNRMFISARPHMEAELKAKLNAVVTNLMPFSEDDQKEFLRKYFEAKNISSGKIENKLSTIDSFLKNLVENSIAESSSNPLVLGCVAEIFENDQIPTEINLYTVFESFVQKKINLAMKKIHGNQTNMLLTEQVNAMRFHHRQSLRIIFGHNFDDQTIQDCFRESTEPALAAMAAIGLIKFLDNSKTLQLTHRMIAEFFVADLLFNKIFLANKYPGSSSFSSFFTSKRTLAMFVLLREIWERGPNQTNYKMIRIFLDSKIRNLLTEKNVNYIKQVETIILKSFTIQQLQDAFRLAVDDGLVNMVYILPGRSFWGTKEHLNALWSQTRSGKNQGSPLLIALEFQSVKFIDRFLMISQGVFDIEVFKKAFREVDEFGRNIFHCAAVNKDPKVFDFLLKNLKPALNESDTMKLLTAKENFGKNFMMCILKKQNIKSFTSILKTVEKTFGRHVAMDLLTNVDSSGRNAFHYVPNWIFSGKDVATIWSSLKETFTADEMRDLFCEIDEFGRTPMTQAVRECNSKTFKTFRHLFNQVYSTDSARREAMLLESNEGFTALHYGSRNKCKDVFLLIQQAYKIILTPDELKAVILRENYEGENILFFAFQGSNNFETLEVLWAMLLEIFDKETIKSLLNKKNYIGKTIKEVISNDPDYNEKIQILNKI